MDEIMEITDHIQEAAGQTAEVIWGYGTDENLEDLCVTVIATGFDAAELDKPIHVWSQEGVAEDQSQETRSQCSSVVPTPEVEPFIKTEEHSGSIDKNKRDVAAPQKDLFAPAEDVVESAVPSQKTQAALPQDSLTHKEELAIDEVSNPASQVENTDVSKNDVTTNEEFIIYNLDDVPEPEDLTPQASLTNNKEDDSNSAQSIENISSETTQASETTPSVQPSREAFAERQRQITRSLAEFKSKLNLPGRIADLENEPAYKRRNVSIEDTPQSSESQVSRMRVNEEIDEEGNRRFELKNDNPFLHDNVD